MDRARASFLGALEVVPGSVEAMSLLGYLNLINGSPEDARAWFDRAIEEDPGYAQSHIGYGDLYAAEQNYREAKESYAKAAELEPRSFHAWFNGGLCALRLGEVETADRYLMDRRSRYHSLRLETVPKVRGPVLEVRTICRF